MKMKGDTVVFTLLLLAYGQHSHAVKTNSESANLPAQALNNEDQEVNSPKVTHETASPRDRGQEEEVCKISESHPSVQEGECQVNGNDTVDLAQQFKGLRMDDHAEQSTKETEGGGMEAGGLVSVSDLIDEIRDMTIPPDQEDSEMAQEPGSTDVDPTKVAALGTFQTQVTDSDIGNDNRRLEVSGSRPQDSFQRHKIDGDGNCFFSAVVDQLNHLDLPQRYIHNRKVDHFDLRGMACTYLSNLPEDAKKELSESLEGDADLLRRFQTYINNMRENGEYAEHIIIQALADRLLLQIDIYINDNYEKPSVTIEPRSQQGPWPRINLHLTQHSRQDSPLDHYDSLHLTDVERQTSESSQTNQNQNHESRMGFSSSVLDYYTDQLSNTDQPFRTDQPLHRNIRNRKQPMQNKNQDVHADQSPPSYPRKETRTESAVNSIRNPPMKLKSVKFEQPVVMRRNSGSGSKSRKVLQPGERTDTKLDTVDGEETKAVAVESEYDDQVPKLLSPYLKVKRISSPKDLRRIIHERNYPMHIAIRRSLFGLSYFHHQIITRSEASDDITRITVAHSGQLSIQEFLSSGVCGTIHTSEFQISDEHELSGYMNFNEGIYLIDDFYPQSEDESDKIMQRIDENIRECPLYSFSTFNCEKFAIYAMTGRDDWTITQIDYMPESQKIFAHFLDYFIPMNWLQLIISSGIFILPFFNQYFSVPFLKEVALISQSLVPVLKIPYVNNLKKFVPYEICRRQNINFMLTTLMSVLCTYFCTAVLDMPSLHARTLLFISIGNYKFNSLFFANAASLYDRYRIPQVPFSMGQLRTYTGTFFICMKNCAVSFVHFGYNSFIFIYRKFTFFPLKYHNPEENNACNKKEKELEKDNETQVNIFIKTYLFLSTCLRLLWPVGNDDTQ